MARPKRTQALILQFVRREVPALLSDPQPDHEALADFVRKSNEIEGIVDAAGSSLYDDHLGVAASVAQVSHRVIQEPLEIHRRLMRSQREHTPGQYRRVWVSVGGRTCPDPMLVPRLMERLLTKVQFLQRWYSNDPEDRPSEATLWDLHHELERVHPFSDGNGRTGRLWLNALRLHFGYDWLTVDPDEREAYYASIRDYAHRQNSR